MPKPKSLQDIEAKNTLVQRLAPLADRLRQFNTKFGLRPYRVFLVWTLYSGQERGEGTEKEVKKVELLPTPKIASLDSLTNAIAAAGTLPAGTLRVTEVSATYNFDTLSGYLFPLAKEKVPDPYDFFYEVVEDGRHGGREQRRKFRLSAAPALDAENLWWVLMLEREGEDRDRNGNNQLGTDTD